MAFMTNFLDLILEQTYCLFENEILFSRGFYNIDFFVCEQIINIGFVRCFHDLN